MLPRVSHVDLIAGQAVDRYTVLGPLGAGGVASVFRVRHNDLGTMHALKVVDNVSANTRARLRREGRALGQLQHEGIVRVTDFIDVGGAPGLVMELVNGPNLAELMNQTRLETPLLDDLVGQLLSAVGAAHAAGLLHRDLKPANILLSPLEGGKYRLKVADFGLVKALLDTNTDTLETAEGVFLGTPAYMAPEQAGRDEDPLPAADIWALGAILYEMTTGKRAFDGKSLMMVLGAVSQARYDEEALENVHPDHAAAIRAALVVDRTKRLGSCSDLLDVWNGRGKPTDLHSVANTFAPDLSLETGLPIPSKRGASLGLAVAAVVALVGIVAGLFLFPGILFQPVAVEPGPVGLPESGGLVVQPAKVEKVGQAPEPTAPVESDQGVTEDVEPPQVIVEVAKPAPVPSPVVAVPPHPAPVTPEPEVTFGVTFTSVPMDAVVSVDGRSVGHTPIVDLALTEGHHQVQMNLGELQIVRDIDVGGRAPVRYVWLSRGDEWSSGY
jgi:eukaryotic-like serine/threonine-protein kinase